MFRGEIRNIILKYITEQLYKARTYHSGNGYFNLQSILIRNNMKKTIISWMTAMVILSAISCKKNTDSNLLTVGSPKAGKQALNSLVVTVPLGGNIQAAIDTVAASGGGTVNLASGTWTITAPIRLKANITLNGAGNLNTTIQSNTAMNIITTDKEGLSNLTVHNIKIIGISTDSTSAGIWIVAYSERFKNVRISNVEVTNCGGMGVHIKRVDTSYVQNCNLYNNGKTVHYHDIYVRESTYSTVSDNILTGSPYGAGIHVAGVCNHITITGNTVTGNAIAGMLIQDSPDVILIRNNTVSNNGVSHISAHGDGISFTGTNAAIDSNTVNNNYEGGIHTWNGSGSVTNNHASGNSINYNIHGTYTQSNNL
ncbi:MAG: C-terminal target protein [Mucilaginibacter sp.]|nr:C-terminal target protein [Mucilaginibacter sp.]